MSPLFYCIVCHTKEKKDGPPGDLLVKQARSDKAMVQATDEYAKRVNIDADLSLVITGASLNDQTTFTCMVVSDSNLLEYPVSVQVHSKTATPTSNINVILVIVINCRSSTRGALFFLVLFQFGGLGRID